METYQVMAFYRKLDCHWSMFFKASRQLYKVKKLGSGTFTNSKKIDDLMSNIIGKNPSSPKNISEEAITFIMKAPFMLYVYAISLKKYLSLYMDS